MKRFLSSVILCFSLFLIGLFCFMPGAEAQDNVLPGLLNLPAPPPPNPFFRPSGTEPRDENFYDKEKPPADDAPIEDLLDYWTAQSNGYRALGYNPRPSARSLDRLMDEIERNPDKLTGLLNVLGESGETADFVKKIYDTEVSARKLEKEWREAVRRWLTYNSNYFPNDLAPRAQAATDVGEYVSNQDELLALARVNWEKARPMVERLYNDPTKPVSQVLAKWAFYKHALETDSLGDIDRYRDELKQVVEDRKATDGMRDLALDALVKEKDWSGRDDWYLGLLEDETLADLRVNGQTYTGLTTMIYYAPADKFLEKMIELLKSSNPTVRNAAVRNLSLLLDRTKNPELIKAMLPWLENPKWAKEVSGERARLVAALRNYQIPESVPGLIAMLGEGEKRPVATSNTNSVNRPAGNFNRPVTNSISSNTSSTERMVDNYPYRSAAIMALEKQKSPLAAGPLRQVLTAVENWERPNVVRALLASNGYPVAEQVDALEVYIQSAYQMKDQSRVLSGNTNGDDFEISEKLPPVLAANVPRDQNSPIYLKLVLASQLIAIEEPGEELVKAVIERIAFHEKRNPPIAEALRSIVQNWKGTAINALLLRDLKGGKTNLNALVRLLTIRRELREKQLNDVTDIRAGSPTALGISACLLEEPGDYDAILDGGGDEAKTALLGCARMIRAPLPVQKVAANLNSQNKMLVLAAERYLESEDSPEARQLVLARHPNEARILGARTAFVPDTLSSEKAYFSEMQALFSSVDASFAKVSPYFFYGIGIDDTTEKKLQKEVKENQELYGVYSYDDNFVRIYRDRAVFSWQDDPARYRERVLAPEEFEMLKNFLVAQQVDELPPFLSACMECPGKELLMLGKNGGRRVFVKTAPLPPFFSELENIFTEFRRPPAAIHYYLEKQIAGLEVLFADENLEAKTLWKNGDDFRVLIEDLAQRRQNEKLLEESEKEETPPEMMPAENSETETEKTEEIEETRSDEERFDNPDEVSREQQQLARQKEYGSYTWFKFDKTKLLEPVAQPAAVEFIPLVDGFAVQPSMQQWKARAPGVEIRSDQTGLYKISRGQLTKIRDGLFYKPFVTPNGRWAIVTKYSEKEDEYGINLMRINLVTNKEFKIESGEEGTSTEALAFLPTLNKIVLFSGYGGEEPEYESAERQGDFFLLDPETGVVQPLRGEGRPFLQQTFRALQPVGASPDLFWTALPDREKSVTRFGIYNAKTFVFKPLVTIPEIIFDSLNMWVDEKETRIYFVYEGQLLALPLPKNP
jgi:hypothetical protein